MTFHGADTYDDLIIKENVFTSGIILCRQPVICCVRRHPKSRVSELPGPETQEVEVASRECQQNQCGTWSRDSRTESVRYLVQRLKKWEWLPVSVSRISAVPGPETQEVGVASRLLALSDIQDLENRSLRGFKSQVSTRKTLIMYGVIHVVIKDMIVSLYGQDAMDNILSEAGLEESQHFKMFYSYPDQVLEDLIGATSACLAGHRLLPACTHRMMITPFIPEGHLGVKALLRDLSACQ
ncbi:hypothetical protein RRG08_019960 [Elysia crispata]|uniref:Heme NO-binding domain-containing protein n=1 Tax=Elysia crispata TaxID=231223 RepID=A0AAE0YIM2_9GAST|nr:hypothetical protein RRG08_019960 [Elysia crispata]